jgi:hypothetical protein
VRPPRVHVARQGPGLRLMMISRSFFTPRSPGAGRCKTEESSVGVVPRAQRPARENFALPLLLSLWRTPAGVSGRDPQHLVRYGGGGL